MLIRNSLAIKKKSVVKTVSGGRKEAIRYTFKTPMKNLLNFNKLQNNLIPMKSLGS